MNRRSFLRAQIAEFVDRISKNVEHTSKCLSSNRNGNRFSSVFNFDSARESVRRRHGNRSNVPAAKVLRNFEYGFYPVVFNNKRVLKRGRFSGERYVHDRTDDLGDCSFLHIWLNIECRIWNMVLIIRWRLFRRLFLAFL